MKPTDIIQHIKTVPVSKQELIDAANHQNQSVRGSAFQLLAERFSGDKDVVDLLHHAALDPSNSTPVMGASTLAHLCVKLLSSMREPTASAVAESLVAQWPSNDKADLEWFLTHG